MEEKQNPLLCDPDTGVCELPVSPARGEVTVSSQTSEKIQIIYFTDPICSTCWGVEPALRRLKLEYGHAVEFRYHMGGLLPDWSYNSGGISKPSDVAHHWDEVSLRFDMPIDGDVWLEDPLHSSYPPSIAFKAAQMQDEHRALVFLRLIREMVFMEKKNITRWENLSEAARLAGLELEKFQYDYENNAADLFREDLNLGASLGVRGFPTFFLNGQEGRQEYIYGFRPYAVFEEAIKRLNPKVSREEYDKSWQNLFENYPGLTTREFAELSGLSTHNVVSMLEKLSADGELKKTETKNGIYWKRKIS